MYYPKVRTSIKLLVYGVLIIWSIYCILPLYWVFTSAFKPVAETRSFPPTLIPKHPTLLNFVKVATGSFGLQPFINSIIISLGCAFVAIVISALAGYGFSRFRFRGRRPLLLSLLIVNFIPLLAILIPIYRTFVLYGLYDTYLALIIMDGIRIAPFCTWLMLGFYESIPYTLEEAAMLDGCSRLRALWHVVFPLVSPGIAAVAIFAYLEGWNDFTLAVILTSSERIRPYTVQLFKLIGERSFVQWNELSAASFMAVVPVLIAFGIFQKHFVSGLTRGAIKE
ncbi:MAG TPA: carbohydrate ABC transporter permease [Candidatus Aerophobetes bacterium]|uniref:Carbohydrate ABC transporter permease n=1 Tax=Aerophobetes bacterium TaxID=2030807 RepID=A0A7V0QRQ8_UNCAE|nr:carbohydrate ABC transporter permease [Candidatus Aerophobetes bacterium]